DQFSSDRAHRRYSAGFAESGRRPRRGGKGTGDSGRASLIAAVTAPTTTDEKRIIRAPAGSPYRAKRSLLQRGCRRARDASSLIAAVFSPAAPGRPVGCPAGLGRRAIKPHNSPFAGGAKKNSHPAAPRDASHCRAPINQKFRIFLAKPDRR